jgi:hypothetical protein
VLDYEGTDEEVATATAAAAVKPPVQRVKSSAPKAALAGRVRKPAAAAAAAAPRAAAPRAVAAAAAAAPNPKPSRSAAAKPAKSTAAKAAKSKITAALKEIAAAGPAPAASESIDSGRLFDLTDWADAFGQQKEQLEAEQKQHSSTREQLLAAKSEAKREKAARAAATEHFQQQAQNLLRSTEDRLNAQLQLHCREVESLRTQLHAANVQYGELVRRSKRVIVENPDGTESVFAKFFWYTDTPYDQVQHFRQWEHPQHRGLFDILFTQAAVDSRLAH